MTAINPESDESESVSDVEFLTGVIGPDLTDLLETPENHRVAREVFRILTKLDEPQTACSWLWGQNPQLRDDNPLIAIREGRGADVLEAARSHARGENAN